MSSTDVASISVEETDQNKTDQVTTENKSDVDSYDHNFYRTDASNHLKRIIPNFPTPSERYYDIRVVPGKERRSYFGEVGDQCLMFHSNRICLVTLSPSHPVIAQNKTILRIEHTFEGYEKIDRLSSQPVGKSKKGGQKLQKNSPICAIICTDEKKYIITASLGAKLIEVNSRICSNFSLIKDKTLSSGYIAIIQPHDWKRTEEIRLSLPKLDYLKDQ